MALYTRCYIFKNKNLIHTLMAYDLAKAYIVFARVYGDGFELFENNYPDDYNHNNSYDYTIIGEECHIDIGLILSKQVI